MVEEFSKYDMGDLEDEAAALDQMDSFDRRQGRADSSDEDPMEQFGRVDAKPKSELDTLWEKNKILMERLVRA